MLDPKQRQRFFRDNRARIGIGIVVVMALAAIFAPLIARQNPVGIDLLHILQRPSGQHLLGTDIQGRDIWDARVTAQVTPRNRVFFSHEHQLRCEGSTLTTQSGEGCRQRGEDWIGVSNVLASAEANTNYFELPYDVISRLALARRGARSPAHT